MKAKDLKSSILQMAVEGKLVPQDPADEPVSVLLERIREEKHKLIAKGKAKFPKGGESVIYIGSDGSPYEKRVDAKGRVLSDECIADEVPFEIPDSWEWVRLESVATYIQRGKSPKYSVIEKYPVVAQKCNQWSGFSLEKAKFVDPETVCKYGDERILKDGDLLWNSTGLGTLGRMAIYDSSKNEYGWAVADSHVTVIRTCKDWLDYRFAFAYFAGPTVQLVIEDQASGSTKQKELAQETVKSYLIPIPPLTEQRRIVERVNELMPLVEEYGKLEDDREALDAALPERLRKSVLQMAVRGKLAPQDPSDEPASALLERIRGQRRQLIAEKKMKAPKGGESVIFRGSDGRRYEKRVDAKGRESEPVCIEDEIPFEITEGWEWARLESVLQLNSGLGYKKDNLAVKSERMVRVLRGGNIGEGDEPLVNDSDVMISTEFVDDNLLLRNGQIITPAVTSLENVGKAAIVRNADGNTVCGGFVFFLTPVLSTPCHSEYLHRYLTSPSHIAFCKSAVKKSGQAFYNLSKASLNSALVAIPPLAEQRRIVERIEQLIPLITNQ